MLFYIIYKSKQYKAKVRHKQHTWLFILNIYFQIIYTMAIHLYSKY